MVPSILFYTTKNTNNLQGITLAYLFLSSAPTGTSDNFGITFGNI